MMCHRQVTEVSTVKCQSEFRITDYGHWRLLTTVYNQNSENVSRESGS